MIICVDVRSECNIDPNDETMAGVAGDVCGNSDANIIVMLSKSGNWRHMPYIFAALAVSFLETLFL